MPFEINSLIVPLWSAAVLVVLVVTAAVVDLRCGKVPNWLTYPAIVVGLAGHAAVGYASGGGFRGGEQMGLDGALGGFVVGFLPLLLCWLAGGIGGGDAKLMGAVGALGGYKIALGAMLYGFAIAGLMAVIVMVRRRIVRQTVRRIWHTVVLLILPGAKPADPTGPDSPTVPLAVALCLGTFVAMLQPIIRSIWK
ncbi:MAG: A24 family peptidase [Planctomycetota bacterium]|nr:A24 family peptidase [Planctomycetota bacterium]